MLSQINDSQPDANQRSGSQIWPQIRGSQHDSGSFYSKIADGSALKLHKLKSLKHSAGHHLKVPAQQRLFATVSQRKISKDSQARSKISKDSPGISKISRDSPARANEAYLRSKLDTSQPQAIPSLFRDQTPPPNQIHRLSKDTDN